MKKKIIAVIVCLLTIKSFAQNKQGDSLKALLTKTTDLRERYKLLSLTGKGYYSYGTGENTIANNLEMVKLSLELKDDSLIAKSYNDVADLILFNQGDFNTAINYLFKGIPYAEKANNKRWLSSLYIDIALCYWYLQNAPEQFNFLKKAEASLPLPDEPEHDYMLLQLKTGYALHYLLISQPKAALSYINESEEINAKLNYPVFDLYIKTMYGDLYMQSGDKELSGIYFKKAMKLDSAVKLPFAKYFLKGIYLNAVINTNDYMEGRQQSIELLKISTQYKNNYFRLAAISFLRTIYDRQHNADSAYFYARQELLLKDSVFNQEAINKIQALNFNEEIRAKHEAEERQQNIQFAAIALSIIIFITLFLLLSRTVVVNERLISFFAILGLLVVFEFINLLIHPWLASFTHESPVLMLLALVIIASLLIPLHHRLEHWTKEKMIEKNKAIRLAAAKKTIEKLENKSESV